MTVVDGSPVNSSARGKIAGLIGIDQTSWPASAFEADIAIVGLGYVGLPTALAFHAAGRRVLGIDVSTERLAAIRREQVDLLDSDRERLSLALEDDALSLCSDPAALARAANVIVCVPTPVDAHLVPDLSMLRGACESVVKHAVAGQLLMLTSTTYVGSTYDMLVTPLAERGLLAGQDIFVAFSPERIDPGNDRHAHEDVPRVVGGVTLACTLRAQQALSGCARNLHRVSSPEVAELTKLLENTFRAVNIAMINEFAEASRILRLDVMEVIQAAATKPYGYMPFTPGPGVGGHCIPCDPHYLLWQLRKERLAAPVIEQAMQSIAARPHRVVERAREVLCQAGKSLAGARVLVLGVAYKPDVEDVRESPALEVIERLILAGAHVDYRDPYVSELRLNDGTTLTNTPVSDCQVADLVLAHTLHTSLDPDLLANASLILDATYRLTPAPNLVRL
jgi:UDP-N-acetyl-D-glucosamine dehydrogenase